MPTGPNLCNYNRKTQHSQGMEQHDWFVHCHTFELGITKELNEAGRLLITVCYGTVLLHVKPFNNILYNMSVLHIISGKCISKQTVNVSRDYIELHRLRANKV